MPNTEIIFITVTLFSLIIAAMWMKVPKALVPLSIIYIIFLILNINPTDKSLNQQIIVSNIQDEIDKNLLGEENISNEVIFKPLMPTLEPKPITFESGRSKKDKEIIERAIKTNSKIEKTESRKKINSINSDLILKDIKICQNIYKRTPVGSDDIFSNTVDSLYCYTRIHNPGDKIEVKHVWYYKNKIMTQVRYNVKKSNIYRSWTKKTILTNQIGDWRVDIQDKKGVIIGSKKFKIIKVKNSN